MEKNIHNFLHQKIHRITIWALVKILVKHTSPFADIKIQRNKNLFIISSEHQKLGGLLYYDPIDRHVCGISIGWSVILDAILIRIKRNEYQKKKQDQEEETENLFIGSN